jgi:outer membrane protein assembly factor BamD (BamD/ComL family)
MTGIFCVIIFAVKEESKIKHTMRKALFFAYIFLFTIAPLYADRITNAYKKIQKGDYEKAKKDLDKELSKNPNSAGAFHIYAEYFFAEANPFYDIDSAYYFINKALKSYPEIEEKTLSKWAKESITPDNASQLKINIEEKAFQNAQIANTIVDLQYFIDNFPSATQLASAKTQRNLLAWEQAQRENKLASYQSFIQTYPEATQITEAIKIRDEIVFQDETNNGSLETYKRFVREYPNSRNREQALTRIFYLGTFPHGVEAFEQFVKNYPESSIADFALEWLLAFYSKEQKLAEFAQKYPRFAQKKRLAEMQKVNPRQYIPVLENGLFGFYDEAGDKRIDFQYESVMSEYLCHSIEDDYLVINRNGRLGILSKLGQEIVAPQFDKIEAITTGIFRVTKNAFSGLIHQSGREILPIKYDAIEVLNTNFLKIRQNRLWGLSSYSGEIIVEPRYTEIESEDGDFMLFRSGDLVGMSSNEALFEMHAQRNIRIQADFNEIKVLENKSLLITQAGKQGVIDQLGRAIIPLQMDKIKLTPQGWVAQKDGLWQVYQQNGTWLENFQFENVDFGGAYIGGKTQGKWGIIDMNGKVIQDFKYDSLAFISQTVFLYDGRKVRAEFLQNPKADPVDFTFFKDTRPEKGNYPKAETFIYYEDRQGKKGLFDQNGKKILSPKYSSIYMLDPDLVNVEQYNKYGLVDSTQVLVMPIRYDGIINLEQDPSYKVLLLNRKYGLYSKLHGIKIEPIYDSRPEIFRKNSKETFFLVSKGGKFGLIDTQNKSQVPFSFSSIVAWKDSTVLVQNEDGQWTFYQMNVKKQVDSPLFDEIKIIKNTPEEVITLAQQEGKWGAWSTLNGQIIAPQYDLLENRGIDKKPILFGEKRQEDNQIEVSIHNSLGNIIWKSLLRRSDYYKMLCE